MKIQPVHITMPAITLIAALGCLTWVRNSIGQSAKIEKKVVEKEAADFRPDDHLVPVAWDTVKKYFTLKYPNDSIRLANDGRCYVRVFGKAAGFYNSANELLYQRGQGFKIIKTMRPEPEGIVADFKVHIEDYTQYVDLPADVVIGLCK